MEEIAIDVSSLELEEFVNLQLSGSGPASVSRCIYKVPERIRKIREEAYTPRLVSIGPLHRGTLSFQVSEGDKTKRAKSYFSKFPHSQNFFEEAKNWEQRARACYDDIIELSSNEFGYMTLVDGIFVVEFLVKNVYPEHRELLDDKIFGEGREWARREILHDIMLLENQLPLFVIQYLFDRLQEVCSLKITLLDLVYEVFQHPLQLRSREHWSGNDFHLVEIFFHHFSAFDKRTDQNWETGKLVDNSSATELQEAGVRFVGIKKECPLDIEFDTKTGELKIPSLVVNQWTGSLLGNFNAFEQCQYKGTFLSSYIILMDNLINTPADVDLLVGSGIIETQDSSEDVCYLFNNLYKRTAIDNNKFQFTRQCNDLNKYSRGYWHQWKAAYHKWLHMLKRDYFSNPWTIISVVAAFILLSLTVIQTGCAIRGLK